MAFMTPITKASVKTLYTLLPIYYHFTNFFHFRDLPNFCDPPQLLRPSPTSATLPNFCDLSFDHEVCVCGVSLVNGNVWSIFPKTSLTVYNSKIVN